MHSLSIIPSATSIILLPPDDLLIRIFELCMAPDLLLAESVCKRWRALLGRHQVCGNKLTKQSLHKHTLFLLVHVLHKFNLASLLPLTE